MAKTTQPAQLRPGINGIGRMMMRYRQQGFWNGVILGCPVFETVKNHTADAGFTADQKTKKNYVRWLF